MAVNYNFEWDPVKARINLDKHQVHFEEAATVFKDPKSITIFDPDHSNTEDRWVTIGISGKGRLLVVVHTFQQEREDAFTIRVISSRRATKQEIRTYGE